MKRMSWFLLLLVAVMSYGFFPSYAQGGDAEAHGYKIEIFGTSAISWEEATMAAVEIAAKSPNLTMKTTAEVINQDVTIEDGKVTSFRVWLNLYVPKKQP